MVACLGEFYSKVWVGYCLNILRPAERTFSSPKNGTTYF